MSRGTSFICEIHHAHLAAGQGPSGHGAVAQAFVSSANRTVDLSRALVATGAVSVRP